MTYMTMKNILFISLVAVPFFAGAGEKVSLRVGLNDGSAAIFDVSEGLKWHLADGNLTVQPTDIDSDRTFDVAGITDLSYVFGGESSVSVGATVDFAVKFTAAGVMIEGAPAGSRYRVCDIEGRTVTDHYFDGSTIIEGLSPAVYILMVNNRETLKFVVR